MKALKELCSEIISNEELKMKLAMSLKNGEIADFLAKNGCNSSVKELKECLRSELKDEDLSAVSGGAANEDYNGQTNYWSSILDNMKEESEIDPRKI